MNEKEFKGFLRMLDSDIIQHLVVNGQYLEIDCWHYGCEYDTNFECRVLNLSLNYINMEYSKWLSEVKAERGIE